MQMIAIGLPLEEGVSRYDEKYMFQYDKGGSTLYLFVSNLTPEEIKVVREGEAKFALSIYDEIIFFHFRILMSGVKAGFDWSDCPYSIHFVDKDYKAIPERVPEGWGLLLSIILVEATTGIVQALRACTFSRKFSLKFSEAIENQYFMPFDKDKFDEKLAYIYSRYTTKGLVGRSIVKCIAGVKED